MKDQASTLRQQSIDNGLNSAQLKKSICCFAVASGKGGVGKTFVSVNMAVALAKLNKKVLLVDADLGLANADIVLGVQPKLSLQDAIYRGTPLKDVVSRSVYGVDLLTASSGSKEMMAMGGARMGLMVKELLTFAAEYDVLIFDCAAGIDSTVMSFISAAPRCVIVATPEPTSVMDVYALIKMISQDGINNHMGLIVNMATSVESGKKVAQTLNQVTSQYLQKELELLGVIESTPNVRKALLAQKPLLESYPNDPSAEAVRLIAKRILQQQDKTIKIGELNGDKLLTGLLDV